MSRALIGLFLFLTTFQGWSQSSPPPATTAPPTLKVAFAGAPPFAMAGKDGPSGFSPELWQSVALSNGWKYTYQPFSSTKDALNAVASGACDVLVGNTSITSEREKSVEFSQPFYRSGFQIMVSEQRGNLARLFSRVTELPNLEVIGSIFVAVLIATVIIAYFERRHNPDFPKTHTAGFAEAFYYVMGLITGKSTYKGFPGVLGRLVLVGWMLASLFVVSYVTSVLTSSMTADILRGHIHGPEDLSDKTVGLLEGTLSEDYARDHNLDYVAFPTMDVAVAALVRGKVECLIGDAPVLQYYDYMHPRVPIHEVGPIFEPVNYGFAMPQNSPLREPINFSLLHISEAGQIDKIGAEYFGDSYQK